MSEHSCHHSENETARNALLQQVTVLESEMEDTRAQIVAQKKAFLLEQEQQRRRLNSQLNSLSPIDQLPAEIKLRSRLKYSTVPCAQ